MSASTPLWLSHHEPEQYDRCALVRGRHVCRRCLVLYPGMLAVAGVQLAGVIPASTGVALMWLASLPVVVEWAAEHVGGVAYSASRQVMTTACAAVAFGVALGRHVRHPFEAAATIPAVTFTVLCLAIWAIGSRRRAAATLDWEADFEAAEMQRRADLAALVGVGQPASQTKSMSSSTAPTSDGSRSL